MVDRCVCCGEIVPEGRMVCPNCMVTVKTDSEQAYKNGYSAGYEAGRRSVGRKQGRWRFCGSDRWNDAYECSECGKMAMDNSNYCPNCGAKMDGDGNV